MDGYDTEKIWSDYFNKVMEYHDEPWKLNSEFLMFLCGELSLDERYMREFAEYLDWGTLCRNQFMNINFIREMNDLGHIKWWQVATNDKINLNEKMIEEHLDDMCCFNLVNWDTPIVKLFIERNFSDEFIKRNYMYINWSNTISTYLKNEREIVFDKYKKVLQEIGINYKVNS